MWLGAGHTKRKSTQSCPCVALSLLSGLPATRLKCIFLSETNLIMSCCGFQFSFHSLFPTRWNANPSTVMEDVSQSASPCATPFSSSTSSLPWWASCSFQICSWEQCFHLSKEPFLPSCPGKLLSTFKVLPKWPVLSYLLSESHRVPPHSVPL